MLGECGALGLVGPESVTLNEMIVVLRLQQVIFSGGILLSKAEFQGPGALKSSRV